jgi:predicted transposase YbfD/YdcC
MQSTGVAPTTATGAVVAGARPRTISPASLLAAFANVADPRRRQGTRFALPTILAMAVTAILCNHLSILAIAEWGSSQHDNLVHDLGFVAGTTPCQSTLQRLFARLSPTAVAAALTDAFGVPPPVNDRAVRGSQGVAIDGKAQRGRIACDPAAGCVHALTAYCHEAGLVLAVVPITTLAEKAEAELTVAPALVAQVDWDGRVLTGDALFCQRNLCAQVRAAGGDYLVMVKMNQPTLHDDIAFLFDPPLPALPLDDRREAQTFMPGGHGRHAEGRSLIASTDLVGYTDWPGLAQVFRLERTWTEQGKAKRIVQYGITSLPPHVADAARLLTLRRGHWQIENGLHYVKDVTLGEDRSLIHCGTGPSIMALLRDAAVSLLHRAGHRAIAKQLRHNSQHPEAALAMVTGDPR